MKWLSILQFGFKTTQNIFNGFQKSKLSETFMTTLQTKLLISSQESNLRQMLTSKLIITFLELKMTPTFTASCKSSSIGVNVL